MPNQKTNKSAQVTWGEMLRIQEEVMELSALDMRRLQQARRVSGLVEQILRRPLVDFEPVIRPAA